MVLRVLRRSAPRDLDGNSGPIDQYQKTVGLKTGFLRTDCRTVLPFPTEALTFFLIYGAEPADIPETLKTGDGSRFGDI